MSLQLCSSNLPSHLSAVAAVPGAAWYWYFFSYVYASPAELEEEEVSIC